MEPDTAWRSASPTIDGRRTSHADAPTVDDADFSLDVEPRELALRAEWFEAISAIAASSMAGFVTSLALVAALAVGILTLA